MIMLHTKEGFRFIPGPRTPGREPPLPLGVGGRAATHGGENETTAAIAEGQNAARGSPDIHNHKHEASPRAPAGAGAAAPAGAHGTAGARSEERGGGATAAPTAPSRPGGADPARLRAGTPAGLPRRGEAGGSYPLRGSGSRTPFSAPPASPGRWRGRLPPTARPAPAALRSAPRAAARPGARAAGPDGSGSSGSQRRWLRQREAAPVPGCASPRLRLSPLAAPLLTDSRGARAPHSPAPSGTYQLRLPPPRLPVPRRPAAISPSPGSGLSGHCV